MNFNEIKELMELFSKSDLSFIELTHADSHICMKKQAEHPQPLAVTPVMTVTPSETVVQAMAQEAKDTALPVSYTQVKSPMVGVFYAAPTPEEKPFVSVGSVVKKGDVIGLVEAMKMMNEIKATVSGIVKAIPAENEALVAFDDVLVEIEEATNV